MFLLSACTTNQPAIEQTNESNTNSSISESEYNQQREANEELQEENKKLQQEIETLRMQNTENIIITSWQDTTTPTETQKNPDNKQSSRLRKIHSTEFSISQEKMNIPWDWLVYNVTDKGESRFHIYQTKQDINSFYNQYLQYKYPEDTFDEDYSISAFTTIKNQHWITWQFADMIAEEQMLYTTIDDTNIIIMDKNYVMGCLNTCYDLPSFVQFVGK